MQSMRRVVQRWSNLLQYRRSPNTSLFTAIAFANTVLGESQRDVRQTMFRTGARVPEPNGSLLELKQSKASTLVSG